MARLSNEASMVATLGGSTMFARIGMLRALTAHSAQGHHAEALFGLRAKRK
jgi:hypothetical protein